MMEGRSLPPPCDPVSPGPGAYSPEESFRSMNRSPSTKFSVVGMGDAAAELHRVKRTVSRRPSQAAEEMSIGPGSYSHERPIVTRSSTSSALSYGFGSASRDHSLKLYHGPGLDLTKGTLGAEAAYEPHKCLDHMRKKAPATRLGDPGLSIKDRAAKYSRFPDLKPPDAASALTAEEYVAIVGRLPEPASSMGDQFLSTWRNPYAVHFGVGPRKPPEGRQEPGPGLAHSNPVSAFSRNHGGRHKNAPAVTFGRGPGHRGMPLVGEGAPPRQRGDGGGPGRAATSYGRTDNRFAWLYGDAPLPDEEARKLQEREAKRNAERMKGLGPRARYVEKMEREVIERSRTLPSLQRGASFGVGKRFNDRLFTPHSPALAGEAAVGPGPAYLSPRSTLGGVALPFPSKVDRTPVETQIAEREQFPGPGAYDPDPQAAIAEALFLEQEAEDESDGDGDSVGDSAGGGRPGQRESAGDASPVAAGGPRERHRDGLLPVSPLRRRRSSRRGSSPSLGGFSTSPSQRSGRSPSPPLASGASIYSAARSSRDPSVLSRLSRLPATRQLPTKRRSPAVSFAKSERQPLYAHTESPGPVYNPRGPVMGSGSPSLSFLGSKVDRSTIAGRDLATRNADYAPTTSSPITTRNSSRKGTLSRGRRFVSLHQGAGFPGDKGRDSPGPAHYEGAAAAAMRLAKALRSV